MVVYLYRDKQPCNELANYPGWPPPSPKDTEIGSNPATPNRICDIKWMDGSVAWSRFLVDEPRIDITWLPENEGDRSLKWVHGAWTEHNLEIYWIPWSSCGSSDLSPPQRKLSSATAYENVRAPDVSKGGSLRNGTAQAVQNIFWKHNFICGCFLLIHLIITQFIARKIPFNIRSS